MAWTDGHRVRYSSHPARAAASRASSEARQARSMEVNRRIIALWPLMSVRDIASELDLTMQAVHERAAKLGLVSRPGAMPPGAARA